MVISEKKILIILFIFLNINIFAQEKKLVATEISSNVNIDGKLNEVFWEKTPIATNFIQYQPYNNQAASQRTEVKLVYDDKAIYIAAICYDSVSNNICKTLSQRDDFGQADYFGIYIDPYNKGLTAYGFFITAAGVQVDKKINNNNEDTNWDAVWNSKITHNDNGFIIEMKIPYSALRFPSNQNIQSWSINFFRYTQLNREMSSWNYIDNKKSGKITQSGKLVGLNNINAPIRLSFLPYISSYIEKSTELEKPGYSVIGGVDVKYGINESFTLDMMLIPDFGQIQTDDQILNLSPYETYYDEKRAFFTEGVEIFNKGNIFYSRRIGRRPGGYSLISDTLLENEVISKNPIETQIINTSKFSGKTKSGLGIGFLNGMTLNTYATILDTVENTERKIRTEPFTNYNVFALDQSLINNSYISLNNTNMSVFGNNYYSDVTAIESMLRNKKNSFAIFSRAAISQIYDDTAKAYIGHHYDVGFYKTSGNFRFSLKHKVYSDTYNPNDLGFLSRNNLMTNQISLSYNIYNPFWKVLYWRNTISTINQMLYEPRNYISTKFIFTSSTTFKNHLSVGIRLNLTPDVTYDYFEPRVDDRVFIERPKQYYSAWISSDYRKIFALDIVAGVYKTQDFDLHQDGGWFTIAPRLRINDKLIVIYDFRRNFDFNSYGFVEKTTDNDTIFFGERDIQTITNTLQANYIFNNKSFLSIRVRHYWSTVDYDDYYTLQQNGILSKLPRSYRYIINKDISYNAFNIDLIYTWQFLPGSELSIVFKKGINTLENIILDDFYENFDMLYNKSPHLNSLSFKFIYYFDYQSITKNNSLRNNF